MKSVIYMIGIVLVFSLFIGCSKEDNNTSSGEKDKSESNDNIITYKDISPDDAKERLDSDDSIVLLDVRTKEEYNDSHIPKTVLIPVDELEDRAESELKDKETEIFVYCRSGNRSVTASEILIDLGYKKVYNLGGIIDWPYETESGSN